MDNFRQTGGDVYSIIVQIMLVNFGPGCSSLWPNPVCNPLDDDGTDHAHTAALCVTVRGVIYHK